MLQVFAFVVAAIVWAIIFLIAFIAVLSPIVFLRLWFMRNPVALQALRDFSLGVYLRPNRD